MSEQPEPTAEETLEPVVTQSQLSVEENRRYASINAALVALGETGDVAKIIEGSEAIEAYLKGI